jgi:SAM-dependent methyltransferase
MTPRLSVIAPCLNEEANIDALVERTLAALGSLPVSAELVLVDDGSTDGTWRAITDHAARSGRVVGVQHATNQGIEAAWQSGLRRATGDLVCLIDADLQNQPEDIPRLYQAFVAHQPVDIAQGVRHPAEGVRRLLVFSRALNVLLNLTFRTHLRDNKSGFILCSRDVLAGILRHRGAYRYFQSFLGVAASARGYRIVEIDTVFHQRLAGQSFLPDLPIGVSLRILIELAKVRRELGPAPKATRRTAQARRAPAGPVEVEQWNDQFSREHDIDRYYAAASAPIRWIEGRRLALIRSMVDAGRGDRVLEVGCGGGHVLRLFRESDLTGVDVSGVMLAKARHNLQGYRVTLLKGDVSEVGLPDAAFDRIICTEVLEHAVNPPAILSEIARLLRPGGRVVITFPHDRIIVRLKALCRWSGLTLLPGLRRISWGADAYHLHAWRIAEMRALLERHFLIADEQFAPGRLLPVRCCFRCELRAAGQTRRASTGARQAGDVRLEGGIGRS